MVVVNPTFWHTNHEDNILAKMFEKHMGSLIKHLCKDVSPPTLEGISIQGILRKKLLINHSYRFGYTMKEQLKQFRDFYKIGATTRLWSRLYPSGVLQDEISEYFHLYDLCQTMIIGFVEDERVFSSLQFVKSKVQNRLEKNLENWLSLYVS